MTVALIFVIGVGLFPFQGALASIPSVNRYNGAKQNAGNQRRIIGGYPAQSSDFPWIILINKIGGESIVCTGFIVSNRWIVTAAHCILNGQDTGYISPQPIGNTQAVIGCANLASSSCITYNVKRVVAHPCYTPSTDQDHDDIAMMELDSDAHPSSFALVDGIQGTAPYTAGSNVTIAGFGMTQNGVQQASSVLMRAEIALTTQAYCEHENPFAFSTGYINFSNVICTGGPAGKDSCNGDSGGPAVYRDAAGTPWVVGVLSKGSELPSQQPPPPPQ